MPNTTDPSASETPSGLAPVPPADAFPEPLEEFCQRLSVSDGRVELIGAFFSAEMAAQRVKDVPQTFLDRFQAFTAQPA